RSAFGAIVLHDVRGRRRWVAAESELDRVRSAYRGQSHDVTSLLSAVDGTLLVLTSQAATLPEERSRRLLQSVRGQIQLLTTILTEDRDQPMDYDLAELLSGAVALHTASARPPRLRAEPGLVLSGHPDRVLRLVNNLLVNAERHAPGAPVLVSARRSGENQVELAVADGGPGLTREQLACALEPGWRGTAAATVPGSGLGLAQCRELALAEGGAIRLSPTQEQSESDQRGLTVRIRLPLSARPTAATNSPILQMSGAETDGINGGVAPDQIRSTPIHGMGQ
ncbi:MAG: HAMP domain-containing sensor histidine kinase, partial [Candidatus Dormiibacterota bacterium]